MIAGGWSPAIAYWRRAPRYVMISDAVFSHLAHHRGQLTVYLRLNDNVADTALYGPSADEGH